MNKDIEPRSFQEPTSAPIEARPPVVIHVNSEPDSDPPSVFGGLPVTQRRINYEITLNNQRFTFPNVWVLQTVEIAEDGQERTEEYFSPDVGEAMQGAMFRYLHPKESLIDDIINGRVEVPLK